MHLANVAHKGAVDLSQRRKLGTEKHMTKIIGETPIGKRLKRLGTDGKKMLSVKLITSYLLAKKEIPFINYLDFLELKKKNDAQNIVKAYLTDRKCAKVTECLFKSINAKFAHYLTSCNYYYCLNVWRSEWCTIASYTK